MINDFKEMVANYSIVGLFIAILTAFIRPFVSVWQTFREGLIVFIFSTIGGLILEQWHDVINEPARYGLAGLLGFFAVKIYLMICAVFGRVTQHPELIIDRLRKDKKNDF